VNSRLITLIRRYQLTLRSGIALLGLGVISFWILYQLITTSMEKARSMRGEFLERDLRELVGRYEADERFTIEQNLEKLLAEKRVVTPLLLPRSYYVALPAGDRSPPRQPPRNCFVTLASTQSLREDNASEKDRFCPYFVQNRALGKFLFLSASVIDDSVTVLKTGDVGFNADMLKIQIAIGSKTTSWWLVLQQPAKIDVQKGRYEITAYRETSRTSRERDKRVEGWAYAQRQVDGSQILNYVVRINFKEFDPEADIDAEMGEGEWPPRGWQDIKLTFSRRDVSAVGNAPRLTDYKAIGVSNQSIVSLADQIYKTHAELRIHKRDGNGKSIAMHIVAPAENDRYKTDHKFGPVEVVDGDLLIASNDLTRYQILPDTSLNFQVIHPGNVIEKGLWQALIGLTGLIVAGVIVTFYFFRQLLRPIFILTRQSRQLVAHAGQVGAELPFSNQVDEIGTLARGFNELLKDTRHRAARDLADREARRSDEHHRKMEDLKIRETNIRVIGHEIRSPLQALLSMHDQGSDSRKYVDRIVAALPHLQGNLAPEHAFGNRMLSLEKQDIAAFVSELAANAKLQNIPDVIYDGPLTGVNCDVDDGAIEDAITHILANAARFRAPSTSIRMKLVIDGYHVLIEIENDGSYIADENFEKIFEYGFSTTPSELTVGSGVGLFVARSYLGRMSGSVHARNLPSGVVFRIRLPLSQ
jgi:signal transduction histidine kinase